MTHGSFLWLGQAKFGCCVVVQVGLFREIGIYPLDGHSLWIGSLWVIIQTKLVEGLLGIFILAFLKRKQGRVSKLGNVADFPNQNLKQTYQRKMRKRK
jgi:hypothetical protein